MLCGLPAQVLADGEGEDLSKYDIDLDLTRGHVSSQSSVTDIITCGFDNQAHECTDTAGIISGTSFLYVSGNNPATSRIQVALKEPEQPCRLLAGTYDVYLVMVPDYYRAPEDSSVLKAKHKLSTTLYYHSSMEDPKGQSQTYNFEYDGERVDTVLLYEGMNIPTSYYGFRDFFPYLQIRSLNLSTADRGNGYSFSYAIDRVVLKARSITDREPVTVYAGTCGEDATYSLDITTGQLTISGTGTVSAAPRLASRLLSCVKNIVIENGITEIGARAFERFSFSTITLPETLLAIGDTAFHRCSIRTIDLPEGLQTVGKWAFAFCDSLSSVSLPSSLQAIGDKAFYRANVKEIEIPVNMKTLGNDVFANCPLETVYWNAADCRYAAGTYPFLSVSCSIHSFHIGKQVRHIPTHLCSGMAFLEHFRLGENVETIGDSAFFACNLGYLDIPATTTAIAENAFVNASLAAISVAADNKAYCDVDGILFSKDLTSLVYYPRLPNGSKPYAIPAHVTSLGAYALCDYQPSTLSLPWTDAESIPSAAATTFRYGIVFYVPDEAVRAYRSLSYYNTHTIIANMNLPQYMAVSDKFSVFNKLLVATGWADSLSAEHDEEYERLYMMGKFPTPSTSTYLDNYNAECPSERRYGFTILAETDSVYEAMTGMEAKDITPESIAGAIASLGMEGGENNDDYSSADNALNRFVSYHLLPVALSRDKLVKHVNEYGYDGTISGKLGVNVTEYYETLGQGRRLLKMSESRKSGGVRINRYVKTNPETCMDDIEATDGFIPGIPVGDEGRRMRNGYVYPIKEPLVYTDVTAGKVLGRERMRYDITALLPELENNGIHLWSNAVFYPSKDYPYFSNLEILSDAYTYYLSGRNYGWGDYQGDEVMFFGVADFIIKLPPVPVDGVYELRLGSGGRQRWDVLKHQLFLGQDKSSLSPCGLPVNLNESYTRHGNADTGVEALDRLNDLQLREKGIMKGPNSICVGYDGKSSVRYHYDENFARTIVGQFDLQAGATYYLRVSDCGVDSSYRNSQLPVDFLEWVPKSVYANPEEAEDIW